MININELKPGLTFHQNNDIFVVVSSQHSKQARSQALVKAKIKNLRTGFLLTKTFTNRDKIQKANIQKKKMSFLYIDKNNAFFMDEETFEEIKIQIEKIKWEKNFLSNNFLVTVKKYENEILEIELPSNIELKVIYAPDAVKGNSHNNPYKKVKLETGFELEAPIFIKEEDIVLVSSKDGKYVGKVTK